MKLCNLETNLDELERVEFLVMLLRYYVTFRHSTEKIFCFLTQLENFGLNVFLEFKINLKQSYNPF